MSGYSQSPTISRQLTDDEKALDGRASSFLQSAPSYANDGSYLSGQDRYAWMKKDLEIRGMQAQQLGRENILATAMGDKAAEADQDLSARKGLDAVEKMHQENPTMDYSEATRRVSDQMGLGMNGAFHGAAARLASEYESPQQQSIRLGKQTLLEMGIQDALNNHDADQNLHHLQTTSATNQAELSAPLQQAQIDALAGDPKKVQALKDLQDHYDKFGIPGGQSKDVDKLNQINRQIQLRTAEKTEQQMRETGFGSPDELVLLTGMFHNLGISGVTHPGKVVQTLSGPGNTLAMQALTDGEFLKQSFAKADAEHNLPPGTSSANFSKVLNTISDDSIPENDPDKQQARSLVNSMAYERQSQLQDAIQLRDRAKANLDINKSMETSNTELASAYKGASDKIDKALGAGEDKIQNRNSLIVGAGQEMLDRYRAMSMPGMEPLFNEYSGYFSKLQANSSKLEPEAVASTTRELMNHFVSVVKRAQAGGAQAAPASSTTSQPAPQSKVPTREEAMAKIKELGGEQAAKNWFIKNGYTIPQ